MTNDSAIVLFLYKRRSNFEAITEVLRRVKPKKLYLVADGPKVGEEKVCASTRKYLEKLIDWPCVVHKNYSRKNLGLKKRFPSGIDWVFEREERAIFIEDDCIPHPTFFQFCDELLEKYNDNPQIMTISGDNFQFGMNKTKESYYFSRYPHIWGWATWKRAWVQYDVEMKNWSNLRKSGWLFTLLDNYIVAKYWDLIFELVSKGNIKTWDYQLTYSILLNNGLNIIPSVNLVTNVGVDGFATHTKIKSKVIGQKAGQMLFPLIHPNEIARNQKADSRTEWTVYLTPVIAVSLALKTILAFFLGQKGKL